MTTESAAIETGASREWSVDDSIELYRTDAWGKGYFGINADGHVVVRPDTTDRHIIDIHEVMEGLQARDICAPVVIRFSDILAHRLRHLHDAFARAMLENDYRGGYLAVYPIKVNHQRSVVEAVYRFGGAFGFGLEVGSKPELLAVMALTGDAGDRPIICNGFKDDSYIEAVILASMLGRRIIPVVENFDELALILKHSRRYDVRPSIGVRIKLAAEGAGRWKESAGAKSKFGLFINEIIELMEALADAGMQDCLELVHCHPGSQLHDIRRIKDTVSELAHVYAELCGMGAQLKYIDVGGGLGVDYDGSGSNFSSSMNYTIEEYAADIVYRIGSVCNAKGLQHPIIVSESGRAIAAYTSVLVFNVLGSSALDQFRVRDEDLLQKTLPLPISDLVTAYRDVHRERLVECYHDAAQAYEQTMQGFGLGFIDLRQRALAERLFWATCVRIRDLAGDLDEVPSELEGLRALLSDIYFCNFSIFQSLPDSWAIDQLFPIMPLHRLDERPCREAVLVDITCDSDGQIDHFVAEQGIRRTLPVHPYVTGEDYYLAAFLVGAYQETLGDLHNLFGDTHVVHIRGDDDGGWRIEEVVQGDTATELLEYMQFDVERLLTQLEQDCEHAMREGRMSLEQGRALRRFYTAELRGYTYLEPEG